MSTTAASSSSIDLSLRRRLRVEEYRLKQWGLRLIVICALIAGSLPFLASPAHADLRLCNMTGSRVGIAIGYRDPQGWVTEGWWNFEARECETIFAGALTARYYYVYAVDYDRGGEWSGRSYMCTREREFTIRGIEDCLVRGYDRNGFFEVDTGQQRSWTIQLTDPDRQGAQSP